MFLLFLQIHARKISKISLTQISSSHAISLNVGLKTKFRFFILTYSKHFARYEERGERSEEEREMF